MMKESLQWMKHVQFSKKVRIFEPYEVALIEQG